MSVICGPHLQASAREDVDQMSAVCKEKRVYFFPSKTTSHTHNTHNNSSSLLSLSLYNQHHHRTNSATTTAAPPPSHTAPLSLSLRSLSHISFYGLGFVGLVVVDFDDGGGGGGG
ncbi:hypothetical protein Hdeb2414_s0006g00204871 [Helianthus debilis subsp. tardiflorus]